MFLLYAVCCCTRRACNRRTTSLNTHRPKRGTTFRTRDSVLGSTLPACTYAGGMCIMYQLGTCLSQQ